jgi:hypothetical protein
VPLGFGLAAWYEKLDAAIVACGAGDPPSLVVLARAVRERVEELRAAGFHPDRVVKMLRRDVTSAICRAGGHLASFESLSLVRHEVVNWCIDGYVGS